MKQRTIHIDSKEQLEKFNSFLTGKVFHVSLASNWSSITKAGEISSNTNDTHDTTFGSSNNSYFRNKGCVSVFDYRNIDNETVRKHLPKCRPTRPLLDGEGIAVFVLMSKVYPYLLPWEGWRREDPVQMVVPYIEAGYPGVIPLTSIEEVIFVTMEESVAPLVLAVRKMWKMPKT